MWDRRLFCVFVAVGVDVCCGFVLHFLSRLSHQSMALTVGNGFQEHGIGLHVCEVTG